MISPRFTGRGRLFRVGLILGQLALIGLLTAGLTPESALAQGPKGPQGPQGPKREVVLDRLPHGYSRVKVKGDHYFYHGGHFFRQRGPGFVVVAPPRGAVVAILPPLYTTIVIGGNTYYTYQGVYYRRVPAGFVVVEEPAPVVVSEPAPPETAAVSSVIVAAPALNVREGPGLDYNIIAVVQQGTTLPVHATAPGWLYIQAPTGQFGWVDQQFTSPLKTPASG